MKVAVIIGVVVAILGSMPWLERGLHAHRIQSMWVQDECSVDPQKGQLFVQWLTRAADPARRAHRSFQLDYDGAVFRVTPMYFARDREDVLSVELQPYPRRPGVSTLVVIVRIDHDLDEEIMGDVTSDCAAVIRKYLVEYPLNSTRRN